MSQTCNVRTPEKPELYLQLITPDRLDGGGKAVLTDGQMACGTMQGRPKK